MRLVVCVYYQIACKLRDGVFIKNLVRRLGDDVLSISM